MGARNRIIADKTIVVVGAGGNIGSHLVPHLGRMPNIAQVTLIDRDRYEEKNLISQDIAPGDIGKRKAVVQARKLRRINPALRVEAISEGVETVPLGRLRGDVILACLDSRIARQRVSQFAWRLGVPLIDAGVEPTGLLARVNVYVPGPEGPCMECAWDDRDYAALEQVYPCAGSDAGVPPTNAASSLGALAAALQAIECQKLLRGETDRLAASRQVLVDALHHKHYLTAYRRNVGCRFTGHDVWQITKLDRSPRRLRLGEAFSLGQEAGNKKKELAIRVEGRVFVTRLRCPDCRKARSVLRLRQASATTGAPCKACGSTLVIAGFDQIEGLKSSLLEHKATRERSLASIGLRPGDVFTIEGGGLELHYELAEDR